VQAISLEVTHRCMSRCVMCNIWRIPASVKDLPLSVWLSLFDSPSLSSLRELDITGGEPFLRSDLKDLVMAAAREKQARLPLLRTIAITTNGFLTKRILDVTSQIAGILQDEQIDLVFACAMDGVGEIHNRIRRVKDGWSKLHRTIAGLCKLRESFPRLVVGLKTTVLPQNVDELEAIALYAREHDLFTIISPRILTRARYANVDLAPDLSFSEGAIKKLDRFYSADLFRWSYHCTIVRDYLGGGRVEKPCTAGFNYYFVRCTGDVYPCPLIDTSIGNIQRDTMEKLVRSDSAALFRRNARSHDECRTCTEPGLERYALPAEGLTYAKMMVKLSWSHFAELHRHLGLDKYFDERMTGRDAGTTGT
jgi:MoaA/NifB/PqqE/SkfB family radical SAM enzyme